jgi:hypothetical protein
VGYFREFSITDMTGSYRRVFQRPIDFDWYALLFYKIKIIYVDFQIILYIQSFLFVVAGNYSHILMVIYH